MVGAGGMDSSGLEVCQAGSAERWLSGRDNTPGVTSSISNPQIRSHMYFPSPKTECFNAFFLKSKNSEAFCVPCMPSVKFFL